MMELGLHRIARLLRHSPQPWKAIHVAGTNGKGSVCAYTSAMLHASGIRCGRFTSPHLIDRWDCITVEEQTVAPDLFLRVEAAVKAKSQEEGIKASEFEILTATAFEIFNEREIEVGVVEVGLGGKNDATNVLQQPLVTVITKIGKDHQAILGNSLEEIAAHKAGIIKPHVLCIVDGSNPTGVLDVLRQFAERSQAARFSIIENEVSDEARRIQQMLHHKTFEAHQLMNVQLALASVRGIIQLKGTEVSSERLAQAIENVTWPGRLQMVNLRGIVKDIPDVLLDGAHNPQSAEMLGSYVDRRFRQTGIPVTWLIGISAGKDADDLLSKLLRHGDQVVAVAFGPVDGMPWVHPMNPHDIVNFAKSINSRGQAIVATQGTQNALQIAADAANSGQIVIAGSLYLISDILRLQRQNSTHD